MFAKSLLLLSVAAGVTIHDSVTATKLESKIRTQCANKGVDYLDFSMNLDACTKRFLAPITSDLYQSDEDIVDFQTYASTTCLKSSELRACFEAINTKLKTCTEDETKAYQLNLTTVDELINYACYNHGERVVSYIQALLQCNIEKVDKDVEVCSNTGLPMLVVLVSNVKDRETVDEICTKADQKTTCLLKSFQDNCKSSAFSDLFTPFFKIRRDAIGSPETRCTN